MNSAANVLRGPECLKLREVCVHFRGCFGTRSILELHLHAIDCQFFKVLLDVAGGLNQACVAFVLQCKLEQQAGVARQ